MVCIADVKYILHRDRVIAELPDYQSFGRQSQVEEPIVSVNTNFTSVMSKLDSPTSNTSSTTATPIVSANSL